MKHAIAFALLAGCMGAAEPLRIGDSVGPLALQNTQGANVQVSPGGGKTTVVLFVSTKCPVSNRYNQRMIDLYKDYSVKGVRFVFINSNDNEPLSEIEEHSRSVNFTFPVLKDSGNLVADRFNAQFTPETYVIDSGGVLRYHGRIDDAQNPARIQQHSLRQAIDAVLGSQPVDPADTKAFGCTIKRRIKSAS